MRCLYELEAVCRCPVDDRPDYYRVTVTANRTLPVESILAAVKAQSEKKQFQEEFTASLSRDIGAEVQTVGHHSGVKTTVVCGAM